MSTTGSQSVPRTVTTSRRPPSPATTRNAAPARRWSSTTLPLIVKAVAGAAFGIVLVIALLYVKLLHGSITLGFLVEPIERAISEEVAGVVVKIETVALTLGEGGGPQFELRNVRVDDTDDVPLAVAASARVSLSRRALLAGRIAPESVELMSPRLVLYYSEDGTLSLKFTPPGEEAERHAGAAPPVPRGTAPPARTAPNGDDADGTLARIDLVQMLSQASASARRREHAGAYLREIGLRSATVIVDNGSRKSIWRVPELDVDLDHRRSRSSIAGRAKIESLTGAWALNFRTYEHEKAKALQLALSVQGLVPRGLARTLPQLAGLEGLNVPVWADAQLQLSTAGEILGGTIAVDAAPGEVLLPWVAATPFKIDGGHLAMSYSRESRRFEISPSVIVWGDSRIQFTGDVTHTAQSPQGPGWAFELKSAGGWLGAEPPLMQRLPIDDWSARGLLSPERGHFALNEFKLRVAGAEVSAQGDVTDLAGAMKARLDGKIGPMSVGAFKAVWPGALAPRSREWVVKHLVRGWVQGGSFRLASGSSGADGWTATTSPERGSLTLEGSNLAFSLLESWPALEAPRALLRLDDDTFELSVPEAQFTVADGRKLPVKGSFTVDLKEPMPRTGHIALRGQGPLSLVLEVLDREPVRLLHGSDVNLAGIDGKVDMQLDVAMPLGVPLTPRDVTVEGKARIIDGRMPKALGPYDVTSANIAIDFTSAAAEAKGDLLINGVVAKLDWQKVLGAPDDKQPPLRISTVLDNSYRTQLGLDLNDLVQGDVAVETTVVHGAQGERRVHVRADLANAEVLLDSVAWRKPKGRASVFEFDVHKGSGAHPIELRNVSMVGDDVAIEGWIGIGGDNRIKEFRFPSFSLNVVSSLDVTGKMRPDGVWDVTAKGPRYDARQLFRSLFDINHFSDPNAKVRRGMDLRANIATVIGHSDTELRNVQVFMQKRHNKLVGLDARGVLQGGKAFAAVVRNEPNQPRRLLAESADAGQLFKLVGFYPNALGGEMNLEVNLDGQGPAERTGTLWARNFKVLGDPIVSEVLQNADGTAQSGGRRTVMREQFEFDRMRIPFSVGHGQFAMMNGGYINGPLVGTTIRGKVDFRQQTLNVGGTYVPLSGLNRAIGDVLFFIRPLVTGAQGEGVFGITFAIQGSMADPQVIVNPISIIAPGILREIFQMTPEDPRVVPRDNTPARQNGSRASSVPPAATPGVGDSWSANASEAPPPRKK